MKPLTILLGISLLLNALFAFHSYRKNVVLTVPDGDSLQLSDGRRVRLLGINAPERDACMGTQARAELETAAKGKHVRLKHIVTDSYGRQLAHVIIEDFPTWISYLYQRFISKTELDPDPFLNRVMVSHGLARFSGATDEYHETLTSALQTAKANKLGIWSEVCRNTSNPDCPIKGNVRAGKKTYVLEGCRNYTQTIIDESFGDRWFCSEQEAELAGFNKSPGCD